MHCNWHAIVILELGNIFYLFIYYLKSTNISNTRARHVHPTKKRSFSSHSQSFLPHDNLIPTQTRLIPNPRAARAPVSPPGDCHWNNEPISYTVYTPLKNMF